MPRAIPISANTVQQPIPTLNRALDFGRALRRAIQSCPADARILVPGAGGLSHQIDGGRAGFVNRECDEMCMANIVTDPAALTGISRHVLVEKAGAQGTEFLMWMMMRGALGEKVTEVTQNYNIPISNTGAGTMLECAAWTRGRSRHHAIVRQQPHAGHRPHCGAGWRRAGIGPAARVARSLAPSQMRRTSVKRTIWAGSAAVCSVSPGKPSSQGAGVARSSLSRQPSQASRET
jgi:hypothetical protein